MKLFGCFINGPEKKENKKDNIETPDKKKDDIINIDTKKYEINNNNKYVSSFLFSTFKLIEKVRIIFLFCVKNIVK